MFVSELLSPDILVSELLSPDILVSEPDMKFISGPKLLDPNEEVAFTSMDDKSFTKRTHHRANLRYKYQGWESAHRFSERIARLLRKNERTSDSLTVTHLS